MISLEQIKKSRVREAKLVNLSSGIKKLPKNICLNINCYAYALGIMEPSPENNVLYIPGFTTESLVDYSSPENFLKKVCQDMDNLGIKYRKYGVYDNDIVLSNNEYLIQVLYVEPNEENFIKGSFHFIRKSKYDFWFSKPGWTNQPMLENIIDVKNYSNFQIVKCKYQFCVIEYKNIGYFAVEES